MARSPCDRGVALSWDHVNFVASPISIMANRIALSFGDELEGYLDVSQNFFQTHSTTKSDPSGGATTKPARACYNTIDGCSAPAQIGSQTHTMTLKKFWLTFNRSSKGSSNGSTIRFVMLEIGLATKLTFRCPEFSRTLSKQG